MYQKILVTLDGSELAECVLPHAEALARGCQTKSVVFIRVVEPLRQVAGDYVLDPDQARRMESESRLAAEAYLKKISAKVNLAGAVVKTEVLSGPPAEILGDYATKNQVDLIVIATHGRSGVSRWVWGSVADRILRSACVPVLMVRAPGCFPGIKIEEYREKMKKKRVLFVCEHNSTRSQMAEAWANYLFGEWLEAESAGLEAGKLNPLAIRVMQEVGIDISHKGTQSAFALFKAGKLYSYVITLCDEAEAERCPFFPGITQRLHWSFPAPSQLRGSEEERLAEIRKIRDSIRKKIEEWAFTIKKP